MAQRLEEHPEHRRHPLRVGLAQCPRRLHVDVLVAELYHLRDRLTIPVQRELSHHLAQLGEQPRRRGEQRLG